MGENLKADIEIRKKRYYLTYNLLINPIKTDWEQNFKKQGIQVRARSN